MREEELIISYVVFLSTGRAESVASKEEGESLFMWKIRLAESSARKKGAKGHQVFNIVLILTFMFLKNNYMRTDQIIISVLKFQHCSMTVPVNMNEVHTTKKVHDSYDLFLLL